MRRKLDVDRLKVFFSKMREREREREKRTSKVGLGGFSTIINFHNFFFKKFKDDVEAIWLLM